VDVAPEEIPKNNTRDYVLEPPPADKEQKDDANRNGVVIFAVGTYECIYRVYQAESRC